MKNTNIPTTDKKLLRDIPSGVILKIVSSSNPIKRSNPVNMPSVTTFVGRSIFFLSPLFYIEGMHLKIFPSCYMDPRV